MTKTTAPAPASPCVRNCCLDQANICLGCFRSLDEIIAWGAATPEMQHQIIARAQARKANKKGSHY